MRSVNAMMITYARKISRQFFFFIELEHTDLYHVLHPIIQSIRFQFDMMF